jgi:hypothetical protein
VEPLRWHSSTRVNLEVGKVVCAQKPIDLIALELPCGAYIERPDIIAEDIIAALEDAGWRFSWSGEVAKAA